jgi:hypothetical protein
MVLAARLMSWTWGKLASPGLFMLMRLPFAFDLEAHFHDCLERLDFFRDYSSQGS